MKLSTCTVLAALLLTQAGTAEAKAYKGAEVYSAASVLHGRMEMRMRMIRGSGLLSTFFAYKNGSELAGATWEEIDVEALGKNDAKTWQSNLITGNPRMTSEQYYSVTSSLADGYHTYTIEWTPEYVSWSFDGAMVRKTEGGQASSLINAASFRFNAWASDAVGWAGALDEAALPAYQFVNWMKYYRYDNGQFVLDWTDDFDSFDSSRWAKANWTFDGNLVDFDPANAVVQDGTLILAITKEGATGFSGTVPVDDGSTGADGGVVISNPGSDSGCAVGGSQPRGTSGLSATLIALGLAAGRRRWRRRTGDLLTDRFFHFLRPLAVSRPGLTLAALLLAMLAPRAASAVQGAELYPHPGLFLRPLRSAHPIRSRRRSRELLLHVEGGLVVDDVLARARLREDQRGLPPAEQRLDRDGARRARRPSPPPSTSAASTTPTRFEWTPDYIAFLIDGSQMRRVTGASRDRIHADGCSGHDDPLQRLARGRELRRRLQCFDSARAPIHQLGPVLVVRQRRVPAAMA